MKRWSPLGLGLALVALGLFVDLSPASAQERFSLGENKEYSLPIPEGWARKPPRSRIVEHEFEAKAAEGDEAGGRVTVMAAGGPIDDNVKRWYGQFSQPDGSSTEEKAKIKKTVVAGQDVLLVDLTGTFDDRPPFAASQGVQRPNYRMFGAIIQTKKAGNYFVKVTGPAKTMASHEAAFNKMVEGLKAD
jgi:hypothetical protein